MKTGLITKLRLNIKIRKYFFIEIFLFLIGMSFQFDCTYTPPILPSDAQNVFCIQNQSLWFPGWFKLKHPNLNGFVNPPASLEVFNHPCNYLLWAEQMFLWVTSPQLYERNGPGRVFDSQAFYDVSPPDSNGKRTLIPHEPGKMRLFNLRSEQYGPHDLPVVFDTSGRMLEVEYSKFSPRGNQLILNREGDTLEINRAIIRKDGKPIFWDQSGKIIPNPRPIIRPGLNTKLVVQKFMINKNPIFLDPFGNLIDVEQGQAGGNGVLEAQNGSLVYYAIMVNDVYAYFLTGTKDGKINQTPSQFPTSQDELNRIINFASLHGKTFSNPEALTVEIKTAWVQANGLSNPDSYITMTARIPTYDRSNPKKWVPNGQITTRLALVGLHIAGSTNANPEMLWATFEHVNNSPLESYKYRDNDNNIVSRAMNPDASNWLFCGKEFTNPFNKMYMYYDAPNIVSVENYTIKPSNILRINAWGSSPKYKPEYFSDVADLNSAVITLNKIIYHLLIPGDVRRNYILVGITATEHGETPSSGFPDGNIIGMNKLANTTMETFQQTSNCFSCHTTNTTDVSHIFKSLKPLF